MIISKPNYYILQLSFAVIILSFLISQTRAEPTVRLSDGVTTVQLGADFVGGLEGLGVTPSAIEPGTLNDGVAIFPVVAGGLDLETSSGDIFHSGGLSLSAADGTIVELFNFIIDNSGDQPVLTALGTLNGDLAGRFPLFNLDFTNALVEASETDILVTDVILSLTANGADGLNAAFSVDAFSENSNIGTANIESVTDSPEDADTSTDDTDTPADDTGL
ncbi:MAG: hypothetical protein NMNS01_27990 [Nitrosomonas sp.]|nr:MAG: hypothetical protein NMNS01_27990 [Nitrosomonas sp.]